MTGMLGSGEVSRITGLSMRQLQWWDEQGVICPLQQGHKRAYSPDEVAEMYVLHLLRKKGLSLQRLRKIRRLVARAIESSKDKSVFLILGIRGAIVADGPQQALSAAEQSQAPVFIVDVSRHVQCVRAKMGAIK